MAHLRDLWRLSREETQYPKYYPRKVQKVVDVARASSQATGMERVTNRRWASQP